MKRIQPDDDDELALEIRKLSLAFAVIHAGELCARRAVRSHQDLRCHPVKSALLRHAINLVVEDEESAPATRPDDAE